MYICKGIVEVIKIWRVRLAENNMAAIQTGSDNSSGTTTDRDTVPRASCMILGVLSSKESRPTTSDVVLYLK